MRAAPRRTGGAAALLALLSLTAPAAAQRPDTLPLPSLPDAVVEAIPSGLFVEVSAVASAAVGWDAAGTSGRADRAGVGAAIALGWTGARLAARAGAEFVVPGVVTREEVRASRLLLLDVALLGRLLDRWRPTVTGGYIHQVLVSGPRGEEGDSHGARLGIALERPAGPGAVLRLEAAGDLFHAETGEWYAVPRLAFGYRWYPRALADAAR